MPAFHKILVPLDSSELSERVLDAALGTAAWSGAELILLHVMPEGASLEHETSTTDLNVIDQEIDDMLAKARARGTSALLPDRSRVRAEVRAGNVVDAIAAAVEELMVDLVIMGTHGRKGVVEMVTGSTTEQALRRVPASVFVVRPQGYPYLRD
ncbi:MAG: universal stress protein [Alphaproteobacteria bacterium]|nr:universal stress protein [Alphaproteobacteria bacterium]